MWGYSGWKRFGFVRWLLEIAQHGEVCKADDCTLAASHRIRFTMYSTSDRITLRRMQVISGK
jgi:hypothetical protein